MSSLKVEMAVYGALAGNEDATQAVEVTSILQAQIDASNRPGNKYGVINISNETMGGDPSVKNVKSFGAVVAVDGQPHPFACQENQTIDFLRWKSPTA